MVVRPAPEAEMLEASRPIERSGKATAEDFVASLMQALLDSKAPESRSAQSEPVAAEEGETLDDRARSSDESIDLDVENGQVIVQPTAPRASDEPEAKRPFELELRRGGEPQVPNRRAPELPERPELPELPDRSERPERLAYRAPAHDVDEGADASPTHSIENAIRSEKVPLAPALAHEQEAEPVSSNRRAALDAPPLASVERRSVERREDVPEPPVARAPSTRPDAKVPLAPDAPRLVAPDPPSRRAFESTIDRGSSAAGRRGEAGPRPTETGPLEATVTRDSAPLPSRLAEETLTSGERPPTIATGGPTSTGPEITPLGDGFAARGPQSAAAPEPASTVLPPRSVEALPQSIDLMASRGGGTARMQLHPAHLGEIDITVSIRGDAVDIVIHAAEPAARMAVVSQRDQLADALGQRDLRMEGFDVSGGGREPGSGERQPGWNGAENRRGEPSRNFAAGPGDRGLGAQVGRYPTRAPLTYQNRGIDLRI